MLHGGVCPCCAGRFKAAAPAGLEPGSPFGPNLRAFVLYLRFGQAIPFERLARLLPDLFGLEISEGALAKHAGRQRAGLRGADEPDPQRLLSSTVLQSDETRVRVGNKTFWTWVFHHADSACFVIRPSRGKAVVASSSATSALRSGSPTASARRWAGRPGTIRSASPICCATSSTRSMPAMLPWPPA